MIKLGEVYTLEKRISAEEVKEFSRISMDENLIHTDQDYAKRSRFKQRIVQGPFLDALIGGILGSFFPGNGTIYLSHETQFTAPVFINELIKINLKIVKIKESSNVITLKKWVEKENGEKAIQGMSVVLFDNNNL